MKHLALLFALALFPIPALAVPTSEELAAASEAEKIGEEMFAYDQAAWHATDRFQADLRRQGMDIPKVAERGLKGYVVEPDEGGRLRATFYGERDRQRLAMARYVVENGRVVSGGFVPADGDRNLSLLALRMIDAREMAMTAMMKPDHAMCSQSRPNTLVLPPRPNGMMPVYVLTTTTQAEIYPAGGHYRFDFDSEGKFVRERRFMKSCFDVNSSPKNGVRPEFAGVTHLLDAAPTEIHAFVSRNIPIGLMVITVSNRAVWGIANGKVEYIRDIPDND